MNKTALLYAGLLGTVLTVAPKGALANDDNPLMDAGFENRLSAAQGGWTPFEKSFYSEDQARSGSQSMFNGGFSRTVPFQPYFVGSVSGSFQEFPADPGSRWRLTGYGLVAAPLEGTPAFGIVQVSFFDADGKDLGTVETRDSATQAKTSNEVNQETTPGEWVLLDTGIATAPEDTATIQAFTIYVDYSGSNTSQGVYFDDLTLCVLEDGDNESSPCGDE